MPRYPGNPSLACDSPLPARKSSFEMRALILPRCAPRNPILCQFSSFGRHEIYLCYPPTASLVVRQNVTLASQGTNPKIDRTNAYLSGALRATNARDCIGASSMLFLSRSLGGLVRPRSPPLGSGKVGVRPNPGRCPGPWVVERPASGQTPDGTPVPGGWNGRRPAKPQTLPPFLGGGTAGVRPNPGQGGRTGAN